MHVYLVITTQIRDIPKRDIKEMKAMRTPPRCVRRTLEAVYLLLLPGAEALSLLPPSR